MKHPAVGDTVHYVSHGTPGGEYGRECRAAIVTQAYEPNAGGLGDGNAGLCVLNPTGMFFNPTVPYSHGRATGEDTSLCHGMDLPGGTWHWPERV